MELGIAAAGREQFVMAAAFDDPAAFSNAMMWSHSRTADRRCAMMSTVRPFAIALRLRRMISSLSASSAAGRLVEDQDARVGDERARDGDALALPARQVDAALDDRRVIALRLLQ